MLYKGRTFLIALFLVNCLIKVGQGQQIYNYIVTSGNDTIESDISLINQNYSPREIITHSGGETLVLSAKNISAFSYNGKRFISAPVLREISPDKNTILSQTHELLYIEDTVFLEVILSGEKMLLQFRDTTGKVGYYIPDKDNGYEWLVHKKYSIIKNGSRQIRENNNYIGQLIIYLKDCDKINMIASATEYNKESLIKLYDYYYGCTRNDIEYKTKKDLVTSHISLIGGLNFTKIGFSESGKQYLTTPIFPWSLRLTGGFGVDLAFPRILGQWSLNNELLFASYKTSAEYREDLNISTYKITTSDIGATGLKLNTMFRGHLPVNYATVFLDIGISNTFTLSTTNSTQTITYTATGSSETFGNAVENIKKYNFGFIVGAGVTVKKFSGTIRYELGGSITNEQDIESKINNICLLVSYKLFDF